MNDRQLLQQALDALTYKKWWRVGLGEPKDPKLEAAITSLNERLAHCDRCGKRLGGEGDIHTCTPPGLNLDPTPISGWGQQSIGMGIPVQPEHCGPSSSIFGLAEMILSDCGCSSDYQPLLNRVAERIQGYIDTPMADPIGDAQDKLIAEIAAQPDRVRELKCVIADLTAECKELRAAAQRPLTDEQISALSKGHITRNGFARAIEAKLMEKNNG